MKHFTYKTAGTCSKFIDFDMEDGILHNVKFTGGCDGNLQGIPKLVEGMHAEEVIRRVKGISCNGRPTSCPDQLAQACMQALAQQ